MKRRALVLVTLAIGWMTALSPTALATCHAFTVDVSPAGVREGGRVSVTVRRDGGLGQSSVQVSTVDGTAKAGNDYERVNRRVRFESPQTQQTFSIQTSDDDDKEPSETFRVEVSDGSGCPLASTHGPDATVTIVDNDSTPEAAESPTSQAAAPSPSPPPPPAESPPPAQGGAPAQAAPAASPTPSQVAGEDLGGGMSGWTIAMIIGLVMAGGSGAGLWFLRRIPA
jgi:hypothetical protein